MKVNPHMVTLAREAAGLTQNALSVEVGISQAFISKIESGFEDPDTEIFDRLVRACSVPLEFFFQEEPVLGEGLVDFFHKKRLTLPAKPLRRANSIINMRRLEVRRLLRTVDLDDVAPFPVLPDSGLTSPEEVAAMVRALWRIGPGPLPDLIALVEAAAVPVFITDLGHEKLSAISMPGITGRHVVVLNEQLPASARRLALAHELGHLIMHNGNASEDMERDADAFASGLLMPADDIRPEIKGLKFRDLGTLKSRWRASLAALIRRAHDLGEITDRQYKTFNIQLNKLPGGRKKEPGEFEPERPRLIKQVLETYQQQLGYSTSELARLLVMTEEQFLQYYLDRPDNSLRSVAAYRHLAPVRSS